MEIYDVLVIIAVIWVFIYTASYAIWTLKQKNIVGGIIVLILDLFVVILPIIMYCIN